MDNDNATQAPTLIPPEPPTERELDDMWDEAASYFNLYQEARRFGRRMWEIGRENGAASVALEANAPNDREIICSSSQSPEANDEDRLMNRVSNAIASVHEDDEDDDDPNFKYTSAAIELGMGVCDLEARAAIIEVARWLRSHDSIFSALVLEREAGQ